MSQNIPKFSVITPAYIADEGRKELFLKCLESIENQTYDKNYLEHVVVNDGSPYPVEFPTRPWIKLINQANLQRLTAFNTGLKEATGEIIGFLDSDDEYLPETIERVVEYFKTYPEYKMVNGGNIFLHADGNVSERSSFKPKEEEVGHEIFGGGNIVNGTFFFKREVYEDLGGFPEGIKTIDVPWYKNTELFWTSPYDFSAYAQCEFPEIQPYFQVKHPDHPKGLPKELGNPWGQDFYLFYKYTRKYKSKAIDEYLLKVHLRA